MRHECFFCHIKTVEELINKFKPKSETADLFTKSVIKLLNKKKDIDNPLIARDIHRLAKKIINDHNLYLEEKISINEILVKHYSTWEKLILKSRDPLFKSAKLAVAGNIIDYGAHCVPKDIETQINELLKANLVIDETAELIKEIKKSSSILYLGDNAGEIVFDKLFIETLQHPNITFAVRGKPIINDATLEDAEQIDLHKVCRVISNGNDAPSTLLKFCSDEFIKIFNHADLIISKGQGNFEGLFNSYHKNIYFMLMAKCDPMADLLGVEKGDMIIKGNVK